MAQPTPVDVLNRLLALHVRSLPMYLQSAKPWVGPADQAAIAVLKDIAEDQELMAERITAVIREHGGAPAPSDFPMVFTDMHDLSLSYLLPEVIKRQQSEIAYMEQAIRLLQDAPAPRAITQEALGAARGHLECLQELGSAATAS